MFLSFNSGRVIKDFGSLSGLKGGVEGSEFVVPDVLVVTVLLCFKLMKYKLKVFLRISSFSNIR